MKASDNILTSLLDYIYYVVYLMINFPSYQIQNNTNHLKQLYTPRVYPCNMQFECNVRKPLSIPKNVLALNSNKRFEYCTAIQVIKML